jgi:hypothetical protein
VTDTATISRTELDEREDKFSVDNERGPHARSVLPGMSRALRTTWHMIVPNQK